MSHLVGNQIVGFPMQRLICESNLTPRDIKDRFETRLVFVAENHHKLMVHLHENNVPVSVPVSTVAGQTYCIEAMPVVFSSTSLD